MTRAQETTTIPPPASIADPFWDLLAQLDYGRRQGLVRRLAVGFYEDWRPSRAEVALLVDFELGRITEAEYLAAAPREVVVAAEPEVSQMPTALSTADDSRPMGPRAVATGRIGSGRAPGKPTRIATFNVDCGDIALPFRLIVRGLTTNGWTIRNNQRYRLMTLHYVLLPPIGMAARRGRTTVTPVLYTAPITCLSDVPAPCGESDGRHRQHSVGSGHVAGSRGPWPLADNVRAVDFVFARQLPVGAAPIGSPAGVLRVDIAQSTASWRPASRQTVATVVG